MKRAVSVALMALILVGGLGTNAVLAQSEEQRSPSAYLDYGKNALKAGNLKDADIYFRSAADETVFPKGDKPYRAEARLLLGLTYLEEGRGEEAEAALAEAYSLNPAYGDATYLQRLRKKYNLKASPPSLASAAPVPARPQQPRKSTWTGLELPPGGPGGIGTAENELYYAKGYLRNKQNEEAAQRLRYAIAANANHAESHFWLAAAYTGLGRTSDARAALARAYQLDPSLREHEAELRAVAQPSTAWTGLTYSPHAPPPGTASRDLFDGKDSLRNNGPATAKDQFLRAIRKEPALAEAHFWLAGAHAALGDAAEARNSLQRAYQLDPSLKAHEAEVTQFGSFAGGNRATRSSKDPLAQCDNLYASCVASGMGLSSRGGADFSRQAACKAERDQCYARNGR